MPSERKYAERLREQAYKTLSPQLKDLEKELQGLSDAVSNGVSRLERKLEAVSRIELPTTGVVLDEIMEDVLRRKKEDEHALASYARDIRGKETQEEILGLLLDCAGEFFQQAALFSVKNDTIIGWSSRGYEEESAKKIADLSLSLASCPPINDIVQGESIVPALDLADIGEIAVLQTEAECSQYFAPLCVLDRPVALLYASHSGDKPSDGETLAVLIHLTALSIENIALKILYSLSGDRSEGSAAGDAPELTPEQEQEAIPELAPEQEQEAIPEPAPEQEQEAILEPAPEQEQEAIPEPGPVFEAIENLGGESNGGPAMEPEPQPPEEAMPSPLTVDREAPPGEGEESAESEGQITPEEPEAPAEDVKPEAAEPARESAPAPEALSKEEEEEVHANAKRFARLLVSEIKLYNQNQVVEGRQNKDLYLRLKRDIDKSREMYARRVPPEVTKKIDYFHDEIVRILGDNDPSTLGSDYPEPKSSE